MLRYAITNLAKQIPGSGPHAEGKRLARFVDDLRRWTAAGVDFLQLREKTLEAGEQLSLAAAAVHQLRFVPPGTPRPRLLINGRADIALASGADGVHLTAQAGELHPDQVRSLAGSAGRPQCLLSVSCHTLEEVAAARDRGADLLIFSPVFGKQLADRQVVPASGVALLAEACNLAAPRPVFALGGVRDEDVGACRAAGAAGIAGIRLFGAKG